MIRASKVKFNSYRTIIDRNSDKAPDGVAMSPTATVDVVMKLTYELQDDTDKGLVDQLAFSINAIKMRDLEGKELGK